MKKLNQLYNPEEVAQFINQGKKLVISGTEELLKKLPKGDWIGGTIPYFMDEKGGCFSTNKLFIDDFTPFVTHSKLIEYNITTIHDVVKNSFDNGFTYILIPGLSEIHQKYAMIANDIDGIFNNPVMGWITGIDLNDLGKVSPKIINGSTGELSDKDAIAFHFQIPDDKIANLEIINIFAQGNGDTIEFEEEGFQCTNCLINGKEENLADYLINEKKDIRLPFVADYSGAMINISIQKIDEDTKTVSFYAPVKKGVKYKQAGELKNYIDTFITHLPSQPVNTIASCNCILNYLYSELEGKKTGQMRGPFTFGEIAYVLVNQTLVYLNIH